MSRTIRKLEEARFFLALLEESIVKHPDFDYFLSAFVSSARSVTWVMKSEYKDHSGWLEWYNSQKPDDVELKLLKSMNDLRVRSEKFAPLETKSAVVMHIPPEENTPELRAMLSGQVGSRFQTWIYKVPDSGSKELPNEIPAGATVVVGTFEGIEHHLPELHDQDVISACRLYLQSLELLANESEKVANTA